MADEDKAKSDEPTKATTTKTKAKDKAKSDEPELETVKLEPVATGPAAMEVHTPAGGRLLCKRGEGVVLELTPAQQAQYRAAGLDVTPSKATTTETAADRIRQRLAR